MDVLAVSNWTVGATSTCYTIATVGSVVHVSTPGGSRRASQWGRSFLWIGALMHAAFLLHHSFAFRQCPVMAIIPAVSLGIVVALLVYLVATHPCKTDSLGLFVAPVALSALLASRFAGSPSRAVGPHSRLLPLHVTSNVLGDGFFFLASATAALYLLQEFQLKAKRGSAVLGRVPPLDVLDRASHRFLIVGLVFMTLGAITGSVWLPGLAVATASDWLRFLFAYVSWMVFCGVLLLRSILGWRGRRAAWGTLAGFAISLLVLSMYLGHSAEGAP